MLQHERRRFRRVNLRQPIRAFCGSVQVQLIDASIAGVRVLHQSPLPSTGGTCRIMFQSDFGPINVDCEVVFTAPHPNGGQQSGLRVLAADRQSQERLREMLAVLATRRKSDSEH
jgi:hypothetical protein